MHARGRDRAYQLRFFRAPPQWLRNSNLSYTKRLRRATRGQARARSAVDHEIITRWVRA